MRQVFVVFIFVAFFYLAAFCQEQFPARIDAEAQIETQNNQDVFVCRGVTNLPEGTILKISLLFNETPFNRELMSYRVIVKESKFSAQFKIFEKKTLPAAYTYVVEFSPGEQPPSVIDGFNDEDPLPVSTKVVLRAGGPKEIKLAKSSYILALVDGAEKINKTRIEIDKTFRKALKEFDEKKWAASVDMWHKKNSEELKKLNAEKTIYNLLAPNILNKIISCAEFLEKDIIPKCTDILRSKKADQVAIDEITQRHLSYESFYKDAVAEIRIFSLGEMAYKPINVLKEKGEYLVHLYEAYLEGEGICTQENWPRLREEWLSDISSATLEAMNVLPKNSTNITEFTQSLNTLCNKVNKAIENKVKSKNILTDLQKQLELDIEKFTKSIKPLDF